MPDVVILDYAMPGLNGIQAARLIHAGGPHIPIILLTSSASEHLIAAAFSVGVRGYVLKSDASEDLLRAIHAVRAGSTFLSPTASRVLCEPYLPKRVVM
jgi:DNA-binding NarL/FixJ family response regulator